MTRPRQNRVWTIHDGDQLVGTAHLTGWDMGIYMGEFQPGPGYESVRTVFQKFIAAEHNPALRQEYYRERDALGLKIRSEHGELIDRVVHLIDVTADAPGIEILVELYPP